MSSYCDFHHLVGGPMFLLVGILVLLIFQCIEYLVSSRKEFTMNYWRLIPVSKGTCGYHEGKFNPSCPSAFVL
jgi:hypothetical protein